MVSTHPTIMDQNTQELYLRELRRQAGMGICAAQEAVAYLKQLQQAPIGKRSTPHLQVFRSLHSMLTHASNVSKLLWPPRSKNNAKARGRSLRAILAITDESPLRSRELRNNLEHFDEQLDEWVKSPTAMIVDDTIGDISGAKQFGDDVWRWYDPQSLEFLFKGEKYQLDDIFQALQEVDQKILGVGK